MNKAIDEVISCITESNEYKECIKIKKQMDSNEDITNIVNRIKVLQKKYIRTNDIEIEEELNELEKELNRIPLYVIYNQKLEIVNQKINYVNEELNDYFYKLLNENY